MNESNKETYKIILDWLRERPRTQEEIAEHIVKAMNSVYDKTLERFVPNNPTHFNSIGLFRKDC